MADQRLSGHVGLEERGCSHQDRVGAQLAGTSRCLNRCSRRLATGSDDERATRGDEFSCLPHESVSFVLGEQAGFAVCSKQHESGQRAGGPTSQRRGKAPEVQFVTLVKRRRKRRQDAGQGHREPF